MMLPTLYFHWSGVFFWWFASLFCVKSIFRKCFPKLHFRTLGSSEVYFRTLPKLFWFFRLHEKSGIFHVIHIMHSFRTFREISFRSACFIWSTNHLFALLLLSLNLSKIQGIVAAGHPCPGRNSCSSSWQFTSCFLIHFGVMTSFC